MAAVSSPPPYTPFKRPSTSEITADPQHLVPTKDTVTPRGTRDLTGDLDKPAIHSPPIKQPTAAEKGKRPMQMVEPPTYRPRTPTTASAAAHQHSNDYTPKGSPTRNGTLSGAVSPGSSGGASTSRCPSPYTQSNPTRRPSSDRAMRLTRSSLSSQCSTPASVRSPGSASASDSSASKTSSSITVTAEDIMKHLQSNSSSPEASALTNLRQLLATMEALQGMRGGGGGGAGTGGGLRYCFFWGGVMSCSVIRIVTMYCGGFYWYICPSCVLDMSLTCP